MTASAAVDLPQPDSPDETVGAAALDREADAAQHLAPDAAHAVVDAEILISSAGAVAAAPVGSVVDGCAHRSNTCCRLSASIATATQIEMIARPGKSTCQ